MISNIPKDHIELRFKLLAERDMSLFVDVDGVTDFIPKSLIDDWYEEEDGWCTMIVKEWVIKEKGLI